MRSSRFASNHRSFARAPLACALLALGAVLSLAAGPVRADDVVLFKDLKPAPPLHLTTLDGANIDVQALRGKIVFLNFWATWCGPCRMEIPEFERLQQEYQGRLQIIGLSIDEAPRREVAAFVRQMKINYPVVMAGPALQSKFGNITAVPTTVVLDESGEIVQRHAGVYPISNWDSEIRALLGLPFQGHIVRVDQMSPNGPVGTTQIPGLIDAFKHLTRAQRQKALARLNSESCTCGCNYSVATCRVQDPGCGYSLPQGRRILAEIAAAKK